MRLLLIFSFLFATIFGAPAYNKLREFKHSDGTTFMARGQGNQHLNWIETEDGEILVYNKESKNFDYAYIYNNRLEPSGLKYETNISIPGVNKEAVYKLWSERQQESNKRKSGLTN